MRRISVCIALAVATSSASAQSAFTRQREEADRRENSKVESQQMTLSVASLFFPMLADLEKRLKSPQDLTNFLRSQIEEGRLVPPANPSPTFMTGCHVFSNDRFVWGTPPGVMSQKSDIRNLQQVGGQTWGQPEMMVTGVLNEGQFAPAATNSIRGAGPEVYGPTGGTVVLGKPITPGEHLMCVQFYAGLVDSAIVRLKKAGDFKRGVIYNTNLRKAAFEALLSAIAAGDFKTPVPIDPPLSCLVPSYTGFSSSNTTYKCGTWVVSQQPIKAEYGGMTVLSQDSVNGVQYAFQESKSGTIAKSNSRSDRRTAKISPE